MTRRTRRISPPRTTRTLRSLEGLARSALEGLGGVAASKQSIRNLAVALAVGAVAALLIDTALQNALAAVRSPGVKSMTPWWVVGRVMERGTWLVFAVVLWICAPAMSRIVAAWPVEYVIRLPVAFGIIGGCMIAVPLAWLAATWLVAVVTITLAGSWSSEGRVFIAGYYYYNVLLGYAPWAGGGITLLALRPHVPAD